jgi:protease-4
MKTAWFRTTFVFVALWAAAPAADAQLGEKVMDWAREKVSASAEPKTIAYFKLKGPLIETPTNLPPLFGAEPPLSVKELLERFKEARQDPNVVAVVVDLQEAQLGAGQLEEIHESLRKFSAVDKEVFVHADALHTGTYTAATGASHISLVPTGDVWLTGIYGESPYVRETLDKLGIVPDIEQCGDYKTAGEFLMRKGPSEESKQMTKWLLDGVYDSLVERMAAGRKMTPQKTRALIDNGPYTAEEALAAGLIDSVRHRQDFVEDLRTRFGTSAEIVTDYGKKRDHEIPENFMEMMSWLFELLNPTPKVYTKPSVALVYVEGVIVTGSAEVSPFGSSSGAYSTTVRKALDKAAGDDSVKAVVLRVDSPGGSALASEIIWDATQRVRAKKPLIVSMGNVAGSGGYYVSCGADAIFADGLTITSSIGVVGGKLVTTGGWEKLGVHWYLEKRGEMAAILSSAARFTDAERAKIRHYMDTVYTLFKKHVTDGRKDRLTKPIDELAGGRVFTGAQAVQLGLIDQIGGLEDAVKYAASRAGVSDYEIRVIPEPPSIFDLFAKMPKEDEYARTGVSIPLGWLAGPGSGGVTAQLQSLDPLRMQAMIRLYRGIELLQEESVIAMMPTWVIR